MLDTFWTSKSTKPAQGQKQNWDMVAHSQVDCKCVFLFFSCAGLVRFEIWTGS